MLPISQTASYALLALSCLEGPGGKPKLVRDVATCTGIPRPYLSNLMNRLAQEGLVLARRGNSGGVLLACAPEDLSLDILVDLVDGDGWRTRCLLGFNACSSERACPAHAFWEEERQRIQRHLASLTLADISAFEHGGDCYRLLDAQDCQEARACRGQASEPRTPRRKTKAPV